jgi:signal transduction histidine kinase
MFKRLRQSLITRLMLYFLATGVLVIALFGINLVQSIKVHFKQDLLPNIVQYMDYIVQDIGIPPDIKKARRLSDGLAFELSILGPDVNWQSDPKIPDITQLDFENAPEPYQRYQVAFERGNNYLMLKQGGYTYLYVVGRLFKTESHQRNFPMLVIFILTLLLLFVLIRRSLKPLKPINDAVVRIGQGDLLHPLQPDGSIEFKSLGQGINEMSQQIHSMLEAKQQLLLAISHELRSPLTRARVNLELIVDDATRQALVDDIREMESLITLILESERLNQPHAVLNRTDFQLDEMIRELLNEFFADRLITTDLLSITINADRARLELLLKNLLDNAFKYSSESDKHPAIRVMQNQQDIIIEVEDYGCGMAPGDLHQATEAFYRADPARQRATGGFGLGLYLCQKIVDAHQAEMEIQSQLGQGSLVRITMSADELQA